MATVRISSDIGHPGKVEWCGAPKISASRQIARTIDLPEEAFTKIEQGITDGCCEGIVSLADQSRVWWFLDGHVDPPGRRRAHTVADEQESPPKRKVAPEVQIDFATTPSGKIETNPAADTDEWELGEMQEAKEKD
jgi:hypothetical protein